MQSRSGAAADAASTVIDAAGGGAVLEVLGGTLEIDGLTLTGGTGSDVNANGQTSGGGIVLVAASLTVRDSVITGNSVDDAGGGIWSYAANLLAVYDTLVGGASLAAGNTANTGGGIYVVGGSFELTESVVSYNSAVSSGGGLRVITGETDIVGSSIVGNQGTLGGGVVAGSATITIADSRINENLSLNGSAGAGLYFTNSVSSVSDSELRGNLAEGAGGGGWIDGGTLSLYETDVTDNGASGSGGAGFLLGGDGELTCSVAAAPNSSGAGIFGNTSGLNPNGVYLLAGTLTNSASAPCNWGADAAGDENASSDVHLDSTGATFDVEGSVAFSCTTSACAVTP